MTYSDLRPLTRMGFAYEIGSRGVFLEGRVSPKTALVSPFLFFFSPFETSSIFAREISDGKARRKRQEKEGGRRWEAGTRRAKWEAGRRQAMDEMLTRRETIDYSRRGRREGGCSRAWNGFPLPPPEGAARRISPSLSLRSPPNTWDAYRLVFAPLARYLTDLSKNYCSLSLCIHRPGRSCGSKGVGDSSRIPAFSSLKRQRLRWVSTWTDNAPLLRDRSMLMTRPLLLSRLSFPRVSNITSACICIFPFSKEFFFSSFLEGSTNVRWTRHCFEGRGRKLRFVFRELN